MKALKFLLCILCFSAIICEPGCVVIRGERHVFDEVEIDIGPPPPPEVVIVTRPPRPSSVHVWIDGHFIVSAGRWVWVEGHWGRPERRGSVWVPPRTRRKSRGWGWTPGHWH